MRYSFFYSMIIFLAIPVFVHGAAHTPVRKTCSCLSQRKERGYSFELPVRRAKHDSISKNNTPHTPKCMVKKDNASPSTRKMLEDYNIGTIYEVRDHETGKNFLHQKAEIGEADYIEKALGINQVGIDYKDASGNTPLLIALKCKHRDAAGILLNYGAHVDVSDERGYTPLMCAVTANLEDMIATLALSNSAINWQTNVDKKTALMLAVECNRPRIVKKLLLFTLRDQQKPDEILDLRIQDKKGDSAIMYAASLGYDEVALLLLKWAKGRDGDPLGINTCNKKKETALILASRGGHSEIVKGLLEQHADGTMKDESKRGALHYAASGFEKSTRDGAQPLIEQYAKIKALIESNSQVVVS